MKLNYTFSALAGLFLSVNAVAQTTLYSENFNGGTHSFTLNTTDMSSGGTANSWLVNNNYTGGSASFVCLGFPFSFTVNNTTNQPAGIAGSPTSNYMHICAASASAGGINNSNYQAADGFCTFDENNFTKMSSDVTTLGQSNVTFSFWWMCDAEPGVGYGEVYYSTDGGNTWNLLSAPVSEYSGQAAWTQQTITNPAFNNQTALRFGFRFVNSASAGAPADPPFSIDDISITGTAGGGCVNTTSSFSVTACSNYTVPSGDEMYTVSGTYMDTIPNASGCDSIMTIHLSMLNTAHGYSVSSCGSYTVPSGDEMYTMSGTYMDTIPNAAGCDSILTINLTIAQPTTYTYSVTYCGTPFTVPSGDESYSVPGTYMDTIPNMAGCDSILTIHLSFYNTNVTLYYDSTGALLGVHETPGSTYEWVDCNNGFTPMPGMTDSLFLPVPPDGSYAVIVTNNTCSDISVCATISSVGIRSQTAAPVVHMFPNPVNENLFIELDQDATVVISDMLGRGIYSGILAAGKQSIAMNDAAKGVYFVTVFTAGTKYTARIVKE